VYTATALAAPHIDGSVDDAFEPVRAVFAENFAKRGEWGASMCVWHAGKVVVDIWGGVTDKKTGALWERDTINTVFSSTKGIVATCFLMLADRGRLDYDAPVAKYWPEFAAAGKEGITVRMLLNHRSGLVAVDEPITLDEIDSDPDKVAHILAQQKPYWEPDSDQGYHGVTYGLYAQELFKRIAGETLGVFLAREVTDPLGADFYLGLPAEHASRVATNHPATTAERVFKIVPKMLFHRGTDGRVYRQVVLGGDAAKAFANPKELSPLGIKNFNEPRIQAMELPWANGIGNARGLCKIYSALANWGEIDGVRLVRKHSIAPITERQSWSEMDRVLRKPVGWSQGFLKEDTGLFSPNAESFGHAGAGGALGWADPKAQIAIGYTTNKMDHRVRSKRALALCRSVYFCLRGV